MNAPISLLAERSPFRKLAPTITALLTLLSCCLLPETRANTNVNNFIDLNGDGYPDILWRNRSTGTNRLWSLGPSTTVVTLKELFSPSQKMVGSGFFELAFPTRRGVVWQDEATQVKFAWFMNGTSYTGSGPFITGDTNYDIVGVADFNLDGKSDLLLQQRTTGGPMFWLMNGTNFISGAHFPI